MKLLTSVMVIGTVATLFLPRHVVAEKPFIVGEPSLRVKSGTPPWVLLVVKDAPEGSVTTWAGDIGGKGVALETKDGLGVSTAVPGAHGFRCVVQTPADGLDPITVLDVTVVVEKPDGTVPVPPPPPVVEDFATKISKAVAAKPEAHEGLGRVAKLYETVADQIKGGLLKTPEAVVTFTDSLTPVASPAWVDIKKAVVDPHLATLALKTATDYEPVWRQIAAAVKAGLTDLPPPVVVDPPIPVTTLHVLVVEEMDDRNKLPASQVGIFSSTELRKWLVENNAQWRMFDDDVDQTFLEQKWKDAMARPRASLPWVTISNGRTGWEGPLPKTVAETISLMEKYR
jgi:hypothetical protein